MSVKKKIIDEAITLFTKYGIKSIRMDDIASNLGISKRTIYEIFGDKETLISECIDSFHRNMNAKKNELMSQAKNVIEEFMILMKNWDQDAEINYKVMSSVKKYYPKIYENLSLTHAKEGYQTLREKLQEGVVQGLLVDNINYDLAISVFSYSIFGIISDQKMVLPNNVSEIDAFKYVITYFFRGIATEKGIKMIDDFIE